MTNRDYMDAVLLHSLRVHQMATELIRQALARLIELQAELVVEISFADVAGHPIQQRRKRLTALLQDTEDKITEAYRELAERFDGEMQDFAEAEEERERKLLALFLETKLNRASVSAIGTAAVMGFTLRDVLAKQAADLQYRLKAALQRGVDAGESTARTAERIRNGNDKTGETPIIGPSARGIEAAVQTEAAGVSDDVRRTVAEDNAAILRKTTIRYGWQQISILDNRTSRICSSYAFKVWDKDYKPIGHALPFNDGVPRHAHCRSVIILILLEKDGALPEETFAKWLQRQPESALRKLFAEKTLKLWRAGKMTDTDLLRMRGGITLDELRRDPLQF